MGRKKIEIRPLVDERNRNVTFLKRKAGLMKKAWELSVLCAADVSILIFSSAGKAYEFSSKDLDGEIDKYLEYEGLIERRRAPEFAAMALAGEDDDDDEDEAPSRRGSTSKAGANGTAPPQPKSLKGKESYKSKSLSRAEMARAISRAKEGRRKGKGRRRSRHGRGDERRSFIDGILSDDESESDDEDAYDRNSEEERRKRRRREPRDDPPPAEDDNHSGLADLQYAMNLHSHTPALSASDTNGISNFFANTQLPLTMPRSAYRPELNHPVYGLPPPAPSQQQSYSQHAPPSLGASAPALPAGMQWDQNLLARYAEFQLQQNHQRQQRLLLERQRAQLQELGIPIEDKTLLDQLFGTGPTHIPQQQPQQPQSAPHLHSHHSTSQIPQTSHSSQSSQHQQQQQQQQQDLSAGLSDHFEWPTVSAAHANRGQNVQSPMPSMKEHPSIYNGLGVIQEMNNNPHMPQHHDMDNIPWGVGNNDDTLPFPSPASPGIGDDRGKREREYEHGDDKRIRTG